MFHCIYLGYTGYNLFLSLKIDFVVANSTDPDEMSHHWLHSLPEYPFMVSGLKTDSPIYTFVRLSRLGENSENHDEMLLLRHLIGIFTALLQSKLYSGSASKAIGKGNP